MLLESPILFDTWYFLSFDSCEVRGRERVKCN